MNEMIPPPVLPVVALPEGSALEFFKDATRVDPLLAKIREELARRIPDVSTKSGRDARQAARKGLGS